MSLFIRLIGRLGVAAAVVSLALGPVVAAPAGKGVPVPQSGPQRGAFKGALALGPKGCEIRNWCQLMKSLVYVDSRGVGWEAEKGNWTDGASIPGWVQPILGGHFTQEYLKAAIIHDHYSDRRVRPWEETHWVFYDALLASNVTEDKAKLLYFGLLVGGAKWAVLDVGRGCGLVRNCVRTGIEEDAADPRVKVEVRDGKEIAVRAPAFDDPAFSADLKAAQDLIARNPGAVPVKEIEALARRMHPADAFLNEKAD